MIRWPTVSACHLPWPTYPPSNPYARRPRLTSIESARSFQGYPQSASNALDADSAACAVLSASLTSIRRCRHLNGCPSELSRYLKKLTSYVDITRSIRSQLRRIPRQDIDLGQKGTDAMPSRSKLDATECAPAARLCEPNAVRWNASLSESKCIGCSPCCAINQSQPFFRSLCVTFVIVRNLKHFLL